MKVNSTLHVDWLSLLNQYLMTTLSDDSMCNFIIDAWPFLELIIISVDYPTYYKKSFILLSFIELNVGSTLNPSVIHVGQL